ncbi:hypothetical protein NC981_08925 [Leptolyngbya sp. DQ-M1]|uniref:hypothetical protein n=1 Tax=Leptolyngbya sp. DQ-M1 TaxID=2933920 RepID=UPI00329A0348
MADIWADWCADIWADSWPILGLSLGLIVELGPIDGPIGGLIGGLNSIEPIEAIKISMSSDARREIIRRLIGGLIVGPIVGLIGELSVRLMFGPIGVRRIGGAIGGLILGLIVGLVFGLVFGLINASKTEITLRTRPNQGIISSAKNMIIVISVSLLIAFLVQGFLAQLIGQVLSRDETSIVLTNCLPFLIWFSLFAGGGLACIQHFSLRLVLFFNRSIPWNYARFLNYTTERMFLQRIGGRYRFIHKLLQDHFAQMEE